MLAYELLQLAILETPDVGLVLSRHNFKHFHRSVIGLVDGSYVADSYVAETTKVARPTANAGSTDVRYGLTSVGWSCRGLSSLCNVRARHALRIGIPVCIP